MFWRKKTDDTREKNYNSLEYEKCLNRIAELHSELELFKAKLKSIETNYDDLRGKFNKKLNTLKAEEEKKDLNSSDDIYLG